MTKLEKQLLEIAMDNSSAMSDRQSFETMDNDADDFFEVSIWGLKKMLEEAYKAGQQAK